MQITRSDTYCFLAVQDDKDVDSDDTGERQCSSIALQFSVELSKHLSRWSIRQLAKQYELRDNYFFYKENDFTFLVRRGNWSDIDVMYPIYDRCRTVKICNDGSRSFLQCSCKGFERTGIACRHILCLHDRTPLTSDCCLRHFTLYEVYYKREDSFTSQCEEYFKSMVGPVLDAGWDLNHSQETFDSSWVKAPLRRLCLPPGSRYFNEDLESAENESGNDNNDMCPPMDSDSSSGEEESPAPSAKGKEIYASLTEKVGEIRSHIRNDDDFQFVWKSLDRVQAELLARMKAPPNTATGTVVGLPHQDFRLRDTRLKPRNSPSKRHPKKKA